MTTKHVDKVRQYSPFGQIIFQKARHHFALSVYDHFPTILLLILQVKPSVCKHYISMNVWDIAASKQQRKQAVAQAARERLAAMNKHRNVCVLENDAAPQSTVGCNKENLPHTLEQSNQDSKNSKKRNVDTEEVPNVAKKTQKSTKRGPVKKVVEKEKDEITAYLESCESKADVKDTLKSMECPKPYSVPKFVEHFKGRVDKMEYNLRLQGFCYSGNGEKLFERKENSSSYSIMNHLSLEKGLAAAQSHRKICSGHLHMGKDLTPSHLSGGFYSQYQLICSHGCNFKGLHIETDVFRDKPEPNKTANSTTTNDSMLMKTFQVAIRNIGFVYSEVECLFQLMGLKFLTRAKQKMYEGLVGEKIFLLQEEVLSDNLKKAVQFEKSKDGYFQTPIERSLGWSNEQISKMQVKQCNAVLTSLGFPSNGNLPILRRKVALLNLTAYENKKQCEEMYGHTNFVRGCVAADCSWLTRTFGNNAKSNCGQVTIIHQGTGLPIAHTVRVITCATCEKATKKGEQPADHECKVNHAGKSIKSMEPEMICELTNELKNKGYVSSQLAADGDAAPINHLHDEYL